jgi:hypothetical protein
LLDEDEDENCEDEDEEIACVGAGLGRGFQSTKELHVMKYKQAMNTKDKDMWTEAVFEEHERMVKRQVWRTELKKDVPKGAKVMTSTWATKKNASGRYRARLNARGYEQVDGQHYYSTNISSPVTNDAKIIIFMILSFYLDIRPIKLMCKVHSCVVISTMERRFIWRSQRDLRSFIQAMFCCCYCKQFMG